MKTFDCIIIGAGPAGCAAASLLSPFCDVLILEQRKLPRRKSCSGVLVRKSVDIISSIFGHIPQDVKCTPEITNGLVIRTSSGGHYNFEDNGVNIVREKFDYWLLQEARRKGASVFDGTRILKIAKKGNRGVLTVRTGDQTYDLETKLVIACDGIFGASRRLMAANPLRRVITFQKRFRGICGMDPAKFYAYTSPEFSE